MRSLTRSPIEQNFFHDSHEDDCPQESKDGDVVPAVVPANKEVPVEDTDVGLGSKPPVVLRGPAAESPLYPSLSTSGAPYHGACYPGGVIVPNISPIPDGRRGVRGAPVAAITNRRVQRVRVSQTRGREKGGGCCAFFVVLLLVLALVAGGVGVVFGRESRVLVGKPKN